MSSSSTRPSPKISLGQRRWSSKASYPPARGPTAASSFSPSVIRPLLSSPDHDHNDGEEKATRRWTTFRLPHKMTKAFEYKRLLLDYNSEHDQQVLPARGKQRHARIPPPISI
ncbi:uncharacterized protein LOC119298795 isoform X2 [Triticum dicoccoides]|uniref:uncharacterized protein LOC119298795 isoform X2 n=1 Tax=Triticum dicoccoides TaxID=85692 RepID=UPI0018906FCF|nr:uncharacterized protein LOC119298795 isoform X2 [Triticum dicoccoides]